MKKFLTLMLGMMFMITVALAAAQCCIAEAAPMTPIDPNDVSWLAASIDFTIVGICIVVGLLIKHCTPLNNRYIPLIVAVLGLLVAVWTNWTAGITPAMALTGMFSGLASTGFHQVFKQLFFE